MTEHRPLMYQSAMVTLIALLTVLLLTTGASAFSGGGYDLTWWTVDGGGTAFVAAGGYTLGRTIGQPDAATWEGGSYVIEGGFWGGVATLHTVYLPLVVRGF